MEPGGGDPQRGRLGESGYDGGTDRDISAAIATLLFDAGLS